MNRILFGDFYAGSRRGAARGRAFRAAKFAQMREMSKDTARGLCLHPLEGDIPPELPAFKLDFLRRGIGQIAGGRQAYVVLPLIDESEKVELRALIDRIRRERCTVLLIEHDVKLVMGLCDQVTVLDHGKVICQGTPAQVQADERVIEAYLGTGAQHV